MVHLKKILLITVFLFSTFFINTNADAKNVINKINVESSEIKDAFSSIFAKEDPNLDQVEQNYESAHKNILDSKQDVQVTKKGCHPMNYQEMFKKCLLCDLFVTIFNASSYIAYKSYKITAEPVANFLLIGLLIWIALETLSYLSEFKELNARDFVKDVLEQGMFAFIVIIFLKSDGLGFFGYIMEPIFDFGFAVAQTLLNSSEPCDNNYNIIAGALPQSMGNNVVCTMIKVQNSIKDILVVGATSICVGFFVENFYIFPNPVYILTGLGLLLAGIILLVAFPFLIIDTVLQLTVACALLPFAMAAFIFEATKKYAMKVWQTFLSTVFNFVFLCLVLAIIIELINYNVGDRLISIVNGELDKNVTEHLLYLIGWESVIFIKLVFIFILGKIMLDEANSFAGKFSSEGFKLGLGRQAGGLIVKSSSNATKRIGRGLKNSTQKIRRKAVLSLTRGGRAQLMKEKTERVALLKEEKLRKEKIKELEQKKKELAAKIKLANKEGKDLKKRLKKELHSSISSPATISELRAKIANNKLEVEKLKQEAEKARKELIAAKEKEKQNNKRTTQKGKKEREERRRELQEELRRENAKRANLKNTLDAKIAEGTSDASTIDDLKNKIDRADDNIEEINQELDELDKEEVEGQRREEEEERENQRREIELRNKKQEIKTKLEIQIQNLEQVKGNKKDEIDNILNDYALTATEKDIRIKPLKLTVSEIETEIGKQRAYITNSEIQRKIEDLESLVRSFTYKHFS